MPQSPTLISPYVVAGRILVALSIAFGLTQGLTSHAGPLAASLDPCTALGYAVLLCGMLSFEAYGALWKLRNLALSLVFLFAAQHAAEHVIANWPVLISDAPLTYWGLATGPATEYTLQTAFAHMALSLALLSARCCRHLSNAATLLSTLVVTIAFQRMAFHAVLTNKVLSVISVLVMLLLVLDLIYLKRRQRPFSGLMCHHGRCQLMRALTLAAIAIPCGVGVWLAKNYWLSANMVHGLEIAFGSMTVLLVGLILWGGDLMRSQHLEIETAAINDPLTKIRNRRGIFEEVETRQYHALIMIDLDGLKWLNDTYGHEAGDEVILRAADTLKRVIGDHGVVGRWGGDEFIVLLNKYAAPRLHEICTELETGLSENHLTLPTGERVAPNGSAGPAMMVPTREGFKQARAEADKALYQRKPRTARTASDSADTPVLQHPANERKTPPPRPVGAAS